MNDQQLAMIAAALPNYELEEELGRGSFGVVLGARHRRLGRAVAIKQLPPALANDPEVQARFLAEAQVLAALQHPHIVPVYDFVEHQGLCLLVLERLTGGTVGDRLAEDRITVEDACAVAIVTCSGLHSAHQHGVLHRDVKPDNLMFSAKGILKVVDFGIAKVIGTAGTLATDPGGFLGTPAYMAPEQVEGKELTPAVDVYGTGVLLYELLSKRLPFSEEGGALITAYRHLHDDPRPITEVAAVPRGLAVVTMRALARVPDERFPTSMEFGVAIGQAATEVFGLGWLERTGIRVLEGGPILDSATNARAPAPAPVPEPPSPSRGTEPEASARATTRRKPRPEAYPASESKLSNERARQAVVRQAKAPTPPTEARIPPPEPRKEPPPRQAKEGLPPRPKLDGRRKRLLQRTLLIGLPALAVVLFLFLLLGGKDISEPGGVGAPYLVRLDEDQVSLLKGREPDRSLEAHFTVVTDAISADRLRELQSGRAFSTRQDAVAYMDSVRTEAESAVVIREDFAGSHVEGQAWPVSDDDIHRASYGDGTYRILVKPSGEAVDIRAPISATDVPLAVSIEVDATSISVHPARYGLFCRSSGESAFPEYVTYVGADGRWRIIRVNEDGRTFTVLAAAAPGEHSPALRPEGPNRLRLDCAGGEAGGPVALSLYANGEKIADAQDPIGLPPGQLGFSVISSADGPGEVQFDNLIVRRR